MLEHIDLDNVETECTEALQAALLSPGITEDARAILENEIARRGEPSSRTDDALATPAKKPAKKRSRRRK